MTPPHPTPEIPIEAVAQMPAPGMTAPVDIQFSPDDARVTYLHSPDHSLTRQLFAYDTKSGETRLLVQPPGGGVTEESLSLEEKLRRERARQLGLGITQYFWARQGSRLIVPLGGEVYVAEGPGEPLRKLVDCLAGPALDAQLSPDAEWVAYVQNAEVYAVPFAGGEPRQATRGARGTGKTNGLAEFVAQEEMDRKRGFWWSPDSRRIAYEEVDETHIPVYRILHQGKDVTGDSAQEDHRYPFAGRPNARVRLGVVAIDHDEPVWMDLGGYEDGYLARVDWLPDGRLSAQLQNREQTELELAVFDPATGQRRTLLRERSEVWINLHHMFRPLERGGFLWASERSGFRHLYLYDGEGGLVRQVTIGAEWMVDSLAGVDEAAGLVYFTAGIDTPTESHLYAASLDGSEALRGLTPRKITTEPGMHSVVLDHACRRFVDTHDSLAQPPRVTLRSLEDGRELALLYENDDERITELGLQPPELFSLQTDDGVTLYGVVYRPDAERFGPGPYPTIVSVYGGPHVQQAANTWARTAMMRPQYLRGLGYLVSIVDNRGSARRGLAFEGALKGRMGTVEVEDQEAGVKWLVAQGLADPERVGIYGWSYGGYMALMCLVKAPEVFKVAVSGAPVTHYDGYDTHYTERYMGTPQSNPQGYAEGSVMPHVGALQGKLLLVHGLIDENVHFRHTARLINALIRARKPYDLLLFPDERHTPRSLADRVYMEERIRDYFVENL